MKEQKEDYKVQLIEELPEDKQPGTYVRRINGKELNDEE